MFASSFTVGCERQPLTTTTKTIALKRIAHFRSRPALSSTAPAPRVLGVIFEKLAEARIRDYNERLERGEVVEREPLKLAGGEDPHVKHIKDLLRAASIADDDERARLLQRVNELSVELSVSLERDGFPVVAQKRMAELYAFRSELGL